MPTKKTIATKPAQESKSTASVSAKSNLEKRLHFAELMLNISQKISGVDSLDEILQMLIEITCAELNAERGTIFLSDKSSNELYSRVALGELKHEIRMLDDSGIAGLSFTKGEPIIVNDAYADPNFNSAIDKETGFVTRNVLCVPIRQNNGGIIGVAQLLNKKKGRFTQLDLNLLTEMTKQGAHFLKSAQLAEHMQAKHTQELQFLEVVSEATSDIKIGSLLQKVMSEAMQMLNAERSTLFLNDEKSGQLWSEVLSGEKPLEIRIPNTAGIAGAVFTSGKAINIPHAYADLRFNPTFDKKNGFFTRSILCVPVVTKSGKIIGVTQVLNKRSGTFTDEDESRLKAFTAQISIGLENANLFSEVQNIKNYNESMLESMASGVVTIDANGKIITCNAAGLKILSTSPIDILGQQSTEYFSGANAWIQEKISRAAGTQLTDHTVDAEITLADEQRSVNLTVMPLKNVEQESLGTMIIIEDISNEKRLKSTMSRYMDPSIAEQVLTTGADLMGGKNVQATILFSDIRGFTTLTEELGPQGTVTMLNEYFEIMVECIQKEGGMLDKYIGDAIMAAFGIPVEHDDDEDRAVRTAIAMIRRLDEWNITREAERKKPVKIGIGLNSDIVVSGNLGSKKRMDFTIIGDGVNLAARLESACKQYAASILVSEFTLKKLRGTYRVREVDFVIVKGKTKPVAIYEVLDFHDEHSFPNLMDALNQFRDGIAKYRAGKWDAAIEAFNQVLTINPNDALSEIYIGRCETLKATPPEGEWKGVWVMGEK